MDDGSTNPATRPTGRRLRTRLPELVFEAVSIVFAVLVALGVDEWREDRADREVADRARVSVLEEMRSNRSELMDSRVDHEALAGRLRETLESLESGDSLEVGVDFSYTLLSDAAWHTAQVTQATQFMDFDWVTEVARAYDLQDLFDQGQAGIVERITSFGESAGEDPTPGVAALLGRLEILLNVQDGLIGAYSEILGAAGGARGPDSENSEPVSENPGVDP